MIVPRTQNNADIVDALRKKLKAKTTAMLPINQPRVAGGRSHATADEYVANTRASSLDEQLDQLHAAFASFRTDVLNSQAAFRGWRVRMRLVKGVRNEFEAILKELEGDDFLHLLLHCEPTAVEWKSAYSLCRPTFTQELGAFFHVQGHEVVVEVQSPSPRNSMQHTIAHDSDNDTMEGSMEAESQREGTDDAARAPANVDVPTVVHDESRSKVNLSEEVGPIVLDSVNDNEPSDAASSSSSSMTDTLNMEKGVAEASPATQGSLPGTPLDQAPYIQNHMLGLDDRDTQLRLLLQMSPSDIQREIDWARRALRERIQRTDAVAAPGTMFTSPLAKKQKIHMHATPETPVNRKAATALNGTTMFPEDMHAKTVRSLRRMVGSCLATNQPSSAVFYASKLATMTGDALDLMLLARSYYATGDFHQAIHALKQLTDVKGHPNNFAAQHSPRHPTKPRPTCPDEHSLLSAYLLLAQAMVAIVQWDDCQDMLDTVLVGSEDHILRKAHACRRSPAVDDKDPLHPQSPINVIASLCCVRGDVCEALESRERAAYWYSLALKCDVHCCDAFRHLVDDIMLSSLQERHLFESLSFHGPEDEYLKCFYASQLGRYDPSPPVADKFRAVEMVHGLQANIDVMVAKAETYYYQLDTEKAYAICQRIRTDAPFDYKSIPVYVSTLVQLDKRSDLFHFAHDLATHVEPQFAPAWLGFGHVFALQDESDQAMASYRTASRLSLGCHLPLLCMGMEHYRALSFDPEDATAAQMLDEALRSLLTSASLQDAPDMSPHAEDNLSDTNDLSLTMDLSFESTDM
ncbi:hypothetical protein DYB30_003666 [Aphanomyces astaci]|uniref:Uncharacterized protein n=2 Tax=Aphanomyces astaci TaxID=112090 RepID=A0A397DN61_APHAT|nr:hypothetical protein DYB30_003666 [Aphanomyces astaci]RHZ05510.1 hypothetical protein DYB26_001405 [Aphanomyces astaci]